MTSLIVARSENEVDLSTYAGATSSGVQVAAQSSD
jgi:hypothetical protein